MNAGIGGDVQGTLSATLDLSSKKVAVRAGIDGTQIYIVINLDANAAQRFADHLAAYAGQLRDVK